MDIKKVNIASLTEGQIIALLIQIQNIVHDQNKHPDGKVKEIGQLLRID